uniref:C2H2-type domain-containing protein n=1 Tax=Erpetoichthys calabaricus TaxID=27687 RepID=A0A8C4TIX9_ERPCA
MCIYKCHQSCRDKPHYHCCFCPHTIMRRKDLIEHLSRHEMVNPAQKVTEQLREHPQEKPREYLKERLPHMQIVSTAKQKRENPFVFQPKFSLWAPWIGPKTRK